MIHWNRQGGRVYPQTSGLSNLIARIFKGIPAVLGTGAWRMIASGTDPKMTASELSASMTASDTIPAMLGADI